MGLLLLLISSCRRHLLLMEVAQTCAEKGFQRTGLMALFMVDSVLIGKSWPQNFNQQLTVRMRERTEELLSDLGHVQYLHDAGLGHHSFFLGAVEEILGWWEGFDNKYPNYNAWKPRTARQRQLQTLHIASQPLQPLRAQFLFPQQCFQRCSHHLWSRLSCQNLPRAQPQQTKCNLFQNR